MSSSLPLGTKIRVAFQGWRLKNAVRHESVNKVKRLATPELFHNMSETMMAKIMTAACKNASKMTPSYNSEQILEHLLHNGGVLSIHCINTDYNDNKPSLGVLGFKWMQMAVDCSAVHDNLKYTMLRQSLHNHKHNAHKYGNELSESIVAKWPEHFICQQLYIQDRNDFWNQVTEKGSDRLLRQIIEITPKEYIKLDYLRYLHERDDYPPPLSVQTLETLHQKGFGVNSLMHLWITGNETSNMTEKNLEAYLDRNHTLVKNIKEWKVFSMEQQRQRLLDEAEQVFLVDVPKVKIRKM